MRKSILYPGLIVLVMLAHHTLVAQYDLNTPVKRLSLPSVLGEISDITALSNNAIACVQDENGVFFRYNLKRNTISSRDSFAINGDYEGISRVGNDIYILRSNGEIFEIKNGVKTRSIVYTYITNIPAVNSEGLCYDSKNKRLLIACKSRSMNVIDAKNKRMIYAFDLEKKKLIEEPVFEIDILVIKKYLGEKYSLSDSTVELIKFRPSAIAIHPLNGKLYLLAASGYLLCIFNNGVFESAEMLDPILFNKAEGITFFKNGNMLISNEGQGASGNLLLFKYQRPKK